MLTKEKILEKAGGEVSLIRHLVPAFNPSLGKKNYKSIFSVKDDKPSMSIYRDRGIWKFKSFNTGHQGDVFRLWADYYGLNCQTQFKELLELINQIMCLGLVDINDKAQFSYKSVDTPDRLSSYSDIPSLSSQTVHIEYIPYGNSNISQLHLKYWQQYGITQSILEKFHVRQVGLLSYTSNSGRFLTFKYFDKHQIASSYSIFDRIKVYVPQIASSFSSDLFFKGQKKSFSYKNQTKEDVFGLLQLDHGLLPYILLTAGEKDCMSAYAHGFIHAISLQSEQQMPSSSLLENLSNRSKIILSCYDNDAAGLNASKRLESSFGIVSIDLPNEIKDLSDYFLSYRSCDFQLLLDAAIEKAKLRAVFTCVTTSRRKLGNSLRSKVEYHLNERFDFRLNVVSQQCEILVKSRYLIWEKVNISELRGHLDRHGISCSLDLLKCILRSFFVKRFHPIQDYFLSFDNIKLDINRDYIHELASYVRLKDNTSEQYQYWYNHLKKWMVRSIRTVFDRDGINKHALILCSTKENIGKSYFCEFLCPRPLLGYYNGNPIITNEKDAQKALIRNFIINLDELHQLRSNAHVIKAWLSQRYVNVRLPYQEDEITEPRISSFIGSTNDVDFLRSDLGRSRWISFEVDSIDYLGDQERIVFDKAWEQAYRIYSLNSKYGDLSKQELIDLSHRSDYFTTKSAEVDLIAQYLSPSIKGKGRFMITTDILRYLQDIVGTNIRLNTKLVGSALRELNFEKVAFRTLSGVFRGIGSLKSR